LRPVGFSAHRRLLDVQRVRRDCRLGEAAFAQVQRPHGVGAADFRQHRAPRLGLGPAARPPGRVPCDLRRLRLHGVIERIPTSHRYQATTAGLRLALFFTRTSARLLRPGLARVVPTLPDAAGALRVAFARLEREVDAWCTQATLVA
jgi:hypothetical protein